VGRRRLFDSRKLPNVSASLRPYFPVVRLGRTRRISNRPSDSLFLDVDGKCPGHGPNGRGTTTSGWHALGPCYDDALALLLLILSPVVRLGFVRIFTMAWLRLIGFPLRGWARMRALGE